MERTSRNPGHASAHSAIGVEAAQKRAYRSMRGYAFNRSISAIAAAGARTLAPEIM